MRSYIAPCCLRADNADPKLIQEIVVELGVNCS